MTKNRGLLLDRDGVINIDHNYVGTVDRFDFMPDLFPFLRQARDLGYRLAVLTNQSGVGRGKFSAQDYQNLTEHMLGCLRREQIEVELVLACFEHPQAPLPAYARESFWRKPNQGMVLEAARRLNLDLARSLFLGDSLRDMEAGHAAGVGHCLWLTEKTESPSPHFKIIRNFKEAEEYL